MNSYDNFFLPVDDLESAVKYYSETLGLSIKFDFSNKGMVAFNVGNEEPAIILKDVKMHKDVKPTIWFVVDDVMAEYTRLLAKGVNFISEPFNIGTGRSVEFEDDFGNRLGITDYSVNLNGK
jgi:predicted enzyme related to lactoylglutathione lyase